MDRKELSDDLFKQMSMVEPYPNQVQPVPGMLNLTAFFPGGRGLWLEDDSTVFPDIMVIAHDFSTVEEFNKMERDNRNEINSSTWRGMIKLFEEANIDLNQCFFSNVYMGLRESALSTGRFPGAKDKAFVERNLDFLRLQINAVKPKLIIIMGKPASIRFSKLSNALVEAWSKGKALSQPNNGLKRRVSIDGAEYLCVAIEHTSMRNSNVKRRFYKNKTGEHTGNTAEVEMLKDAMKSAFSR